MSNNGVRFEDIDENTTRVVIPDDVDNETLAEIHTFIDFLNRMTREGYDEWFALASREAKQAWIDAKAEEFGIDRRQVIARIAHWKHGRKKVS